MSLATAKAALETRRDAVAAELVALTVDGPDISLDGVSINTMEYAKSLREELTALQLQIDAFGGPVVVYTQGR